MPTNYSRARFGAAVVVAFFCGLVFASGFDLTRFGWAQGKVNGSANKPTAAQVAPAADLESAFEAVADHARPAVVSIETERFARTRPTSRLRRSPNGGSLPPSIEDMLRGFDDRMPSDTPEEASGSGFIVSNDGYILTNNHVVADADKVTVTLFDKTVYNAKIIGRDPTTDVAVIKIDGRNFPTVNLGDDANARVGSWVLAIGNPLQLNFTVTAGIVSAKGRNQSTLLNPNGQNPYAITDYIQTDAAINPGNSGGPLLNIRGDVIGINSAIASGTGYYAGYGFAIPITLAKQVMDDLIKYGKVKRAVVGVTLLDPTPNDARAAGLPHAGGAKVTGFPDGDSPGQRAGMEVGDIIIAADGKPVDQVSTLQRIIRGHKPGDVVSVDVMRFGTKKTFNIKLSEAADQTTLASNGDDDERSGAPTRPTNNTNTTRQMDKLGISVEPISSDFAQSIKLQSAYRSGLRVASVAGSGPSYRNLFVNQIILGVLHPVRKDVKSVDDLMSVVNGLKSGDVIELKVCNPNPQDGSCTTNAIGVQVDK
jgi:serine protease Do